MELIVNRNKALKTIRRNTTLSSEILRGRFMDYAKDNVNCEGFEADIIEGKTTLENSLIILTKEFQRVALFYNNMMRIGRRNAFIDYLQGLPSGMTFQFEYYKMYEDLAKIFEVESLHHLETDEISNIYYFLVERSVNDLLKANNITTLDELELIN